MFENLDPDIPIILVATLGLLVLAVLFSAIAAVFIRLLERGRRRATDEIREVENDGKDANIGPALAIVGGIALLMLTLIGVPTVAKGLGLGATVRGVVIVAFACIAATWAIVAMLRRGRGKQLLGGLGAAAAIACTVFGLWAATARDDPDEVVTELRWDIEEVGRESELDINEAVGETGEELFAATGEQIILSDDPEDGPGEPDTGDEANAAEPGAPAETEIAIGGSTEPLPEWVRSPPSWDHSVLTTEAFLSERLAREDARRKVALWAIGDAKKTRGIDLSDLFEEPELQKMWTLFVKSEHLQRVSTSVGDTFVLHVLAQRNHEDDAWVAQRIDEIVVEQQRRRGLVAVSASSGGVLLGLFALYGVLSRGEKRVA